MIKIMVDIKDLSTALIFAGEKYIGEICYHLKYYELEFHARRLTFDTEKCEIKAFFKKAEVTDTISLNGNVLTFTRHYQVFLEGKWKLLFRFAPCLPTTSEWIVPSVMYHENRHGKGKFPTGGLKQGWSFREDRMPVPSCSILFAGKESASVWCNPAENDQFLSSVKTYINEKKPCFEIAIPYTEEPYTYTDKGIASKGLKKREEKFIKIGKNELPYHLQKTYYIGFFAFEHPSEIHRKISESCEENFSNSNYKTEKITPQKIASLKLHHLLFMYIENGQLAGIKLGKGNGILQSFFNYTTGSFLGKSLEGAYILAKAGVELNKENYLEKAEKIAGFYLNGSLPGGLHQDTFNLKSRKWAGYLAMAPDKRIIKGVNTRCNGEVMLHYLKLYTLLKEAGKVHEEYIELVDRNIEFYLMHQLRGDLEGSYGRWWNKDGSVLDAAGTNGTYIISLLAERIKAAGYQAGFKESLDKAVVYYKGLVDSYSFYADTLDADCIDKEAGVALLRAFLDLYEINKDNSLLAYAEKCASFIMSWVYMYNENFDASSALGKEAFKTKGMTSVSVGHHHLDFYGLYIAYDFLRLWQFSGDGFWQKQASHLAAACMQLVSSPENLLNRNGKYIGWQPEQINHTNWTYHHPLLGTKGKYHTCVAWEVVLTLGAMLDIRERFPNFMNFRLENGPFST